MSVGVTIETPEVEVDPGSSRDVVVKIRNNGNFVDQFAIRVLGNTGTWTSVTPPAVKIFTDSEESVRISFAPPRKSAPAAGRYIFGVFAQSTEHPDDSAAEEGAVTVRPFAATTAELVPQTSRGSGSVKHEVAVKNGGNAPVEAEIEASDPDRLLQFEVRPNRLALEPGASATVRITARPVDSFMTGAPQARRFGVKVTSSGQDPFELAGTVLQSARLPSWLPRAVGAAAVLVVVGGVMAATGTFPPRPTPSVAPSSSSDVAVITSSPSVVVPTASAEPPASEAPVSIAPASPTSTPTPSFSLEPGTTTYIANNFTFVCQEDPCRKQAINGMRLLATSMEGAYAGSGKILDPESFPDDSMPVVLEATGPFAWTAAGQAGETNRVVVDFKPLLDAQGDSAYGLFFDANQTPRRFAVPSGLATQVADLLFESSIIVMPTPNGTLIPLDKWQDLVVDPGPINIAP
jgi:hypothetical protein